MQKSIVYKLISRFFLFLIAALVIYKILNSHSQIFSVAGSGQIVEVIFNFLLLILLAMHLYFAFRRHARENLWLALGAGFFLLQNALRLFYSPENISGTLLNKFHLLAIAIAFLLFLLSWLVSAFFWQKTIAVEKRRRSFLLFALAGIFLLLVSAEIFFQISLRYYNYFFKNFSLQQIFALAGIGVASFIFFRNFRVFFKTENTHFLNNLIALLFFASSLGFIYFSDKLNSAFLAAESNAVFGLLILCWSLFLENNQFLLEEQELRYRVEQQLVEKERLLQLWQERVDLAGAGFCEISESGTIIFANKGFAHWLKTSPKNLSGKKLIDFLDAQSQEQFRNDVLESKESERQLDLKLQVKSRKLIPIKLVARRTKNGWLIISLENEAESLRREQLQDYTSNLEAQIQQRTRDLQEQKTELEKVRKFYETLLGAMTEIVMVVNRKGNCTYINPYGQKLLGFEAKKLTGKRLPNFFDDVNKLQRNYGDAIQMELRDYEAPVKSRDGRKILISWNVRYLFDEDGKNIGAMCIGRDVDEKKAAQQKLQQEHDLLKKEFAQKTQEFNRKTEWINAILALDEKISDRKTPEKYLQLTAQILRKMGWQKVVISQKSEDKDKFKIISYAGISKNNIRDFVRHRPFLYQGVESYFSEQNKMGRSYLIDFMSEKIPSLSAASWNDSLALVIPIEIKNEFSGFITLFQPTENKIPAQESVDLFEAAAKKGIINYIDFKKFQTTLQELKELEQSSRLRTDFFTIMAHELRTPLNSIISLTDVLISDSETNLSQEKSKQLAAIRRNGEALLNLINNILDLAKSESGKLALSEHYFSLHRLTEKITDFISPLCRNKGLSLIFKPDKLPKYLFSDEEKIERIILNLLSNAVKYTERGKIVWGLSFDEKRKTLKIRIKDSGAGMSKNEINEIFQAFKRQDSFQKSKVSGTGLGLAITKRFLDLLNGKIDVQSKSGKGTTFLVSIPVRDFSDKTLSENIGDSKNAAFREKAPKKSGTKSAVKILMVDDSSENQFAVESILSDKGYQLFFADDGKQGVKLARKIQPDLILMDMMMPEMNGYEATKKIRSQKRLANVPIIAITAKSATEDKNQALKAGCNDYLSKPFSMKQILETIEKWTGSPDGGKRN